MAITSNSVRTANFIDRAQLSLTGFVSGLVHWNEVRRTRMVLSKLSARELEDIGLSRGDIDRIG